MRVTNECHWCIGIDRTWISDRMLLWQAWGFTSHGRGTNVAGEVFYMLLGISLFEGNMVASGFESYLVALCFILWEGACTGSYRTRSYDK